MHQSRNIDNHIESLFKLYMVENYCYNLIYQFYNYKYCEIVMHIYIDQ